MSKIHWTDETINPVVGCSRISTGCQNCYAENMARRLAAMGREQYQHVFQRDWVDYSKFTGGWNGHTDFVPSELEKPYKWKKPKTIFITSMGDLFHKSVPFEWIDEVMKMVCMADRHTYIVLTKRPERMKEYFDQWGKGNRGELMLAASPAYGGVSGFHVPRPNLVLGVSVEDQQTANERIPVLLQIPAAKRFISLEPMIGPVDLDRLNVPPRGDEQWQWKLWKGGLDGVILGGESGPKARPLDPAWVRLVRDQCAAAGTAFMFKQWHTDKKRLLPYLDTNPFDGLPLLDGRTHTELAWKTKKTL